MDEKVFVKSFEKELQNIKLVCDSQKFKNEIEKTKKLLSNRPLILYGAGTVGTSVAKFLKHNNIEVNCFCDRNKAGFHRETGLPVISPQILISSYSNANIIICSFNYLDKIACDLKAIGIHSSQIFTRKFLNLHELTFSSIEPYISGYKRAYDFFDDNISKKVLIERINFYLTSTPITSLSHKKQYFDPEIISLSKNEIFVDGGMYTGDTAHIFFELVGSNYKHYYGFEPDEKNFRAANDNLHCKHYVTTISKGLWSSETKLTFNGSLTSSSKLDANIGDSFVEVTALDIYFQDKTPPTFIKMDIEGAELEALRGAKHMIRTYKPKLAICAYHKPEDLYTLLEQIKCCRNDYKFYLRHYSESIYETVLYAI